MKKTITLPLSARAVRKVLVQDALKHLHECEHEHGGRTATPESVAGATASTRDQALRVLESMQADGLVHWKGDEAVLTEAGRARARQVIRAHRLYETYLARETGLSPAEWHARADRMEHGISPEEADQLAARLGHPRFDPHGDPIPTQGGELPEILGSPLTLYPEGSALLVIHVGDEPPHIGLALAKAGCAPGMRADIVSLREDKVVVKLDGREVELEHPAATRLRVVPLPDTSTMSPGVSRLSSLRLGESGEVTGLSPACRGAERRRLLDLGFVLGSVIEAELTGPLGGLTAYRVRGTLIALRTQQSDLVLIQSEKPLI